MDEGLLIDRIHWILALEDERSHQVYRLRRLANQHAVDCVMEVLDLDEQDLRELMQDENV